MKKMFHSKALLAFMLGFVMFILIMLPELIDKGGLLIIDGDNRTQGIPFTYHIRDAILSGNVIWDHSTGLGSQFLSSYAYYNLFSPFSLLYLIIPRSAVIYAVPYVTALKFGVGSMLAYFYLRRFLKEPHYAVIGGLLYMFSSFSAYNLVFHFTDVIALFPVLLIGMEELCVNRRRGGFALACCLMAYVNYYFFFGQAVFLVIYFFVRGVDKPFVLSVKAFLSVAAEALIGVLLAAPMLFPVAVSLLESSKATSTLSAVDMLLYDSLFYYLKLIQSAFMVPDIFQFVSLFPAADNMYPFGALGASVAAYIPLFSVAGVISYICARRKTWESALLIICAVMAFVPVLNQLFSALNSNYYARWYYMPILIACLISFRALEEGISFKPGIITGAAVIGVMALYHCFVDVEMLISRYTSRANINIPLNWIHFAIAGIGLFSLVLVCGTKRDKEFVPKLYIFAVVNIYMVFGIMSFGVLSNIQDMESYIDMYCFGETVPPSELKEERMVASGDTANFNHIWQTDSLAYFNSTYDPGFQRFLDENDIKTDVGLYLNIDKNTPELAGTVSVKYFYLINTAGYEEYVRVGSFGPYTIVENPYYIPMGFTYDNMISYESFSKLEDRNDRHRVYAKYLVVDDPQQFADILTLCEEPAVDDTEYQEQLELRRASVARSVEKTADGVVAEVELSEEKVLFLSISYNKGWSAFVDGEEADVYEVNNGLVGVRVPAGEHEVVLKYKVRGFVEGVLAAALGLAGLALYMVTLRKKE